VARTSGIRVGDIRKPWEVERVSSGSGYVEWFPDSGRSCGSCEALEQNRKPN
jgi:hypothetical protein